MTGTCDAETVTSARDNDGKNFCRYISPGRSMGSIWSGSRFAPPLWMPPRPADTTTEEQSPKHVANWHLLGIKMTRTTSSQCLQSYFRRMQHVMARICHPLSIHSEACSIIDSVKNAGIANPSKWLAERLFIAGVVRLEYTRTVALLIHCVLIELNMTDWRVMGVHLEKFATATLLNVFYNFSGDSTFTPNATGLEKADDGIRDRQFNVAALYGDLVSLGIISHSVLVSVMNHFLGCISSISQYRVIYLLVLRATFQPAFPIYPGCLLGWQNMLLFPMRIGLRIDDKIVQRWIIEICNLIDEAYVQNQIIARSPKTTHSPAVNHIWDTQLTRQDLHGLINGAQRCAYDTVLM